MKNFNECITDVMNRIRNMGNSYALTSDERMQIMKEVIDDMSGATHQMFVKTGRELDESQVEAMIRLIDTGINEIGHMATDVEMDEILSFKDTDGKLDAIKEQIDTTQEEIRRAYRTVLCMLGYDHRQVSAISHEKLRVITIRAVMNEFLPELMDMADTFPRHDMHLTLEMDGNIKKVYLTDINGIICMLLEEWNGSY